MLNEPETSLHADLLPALAGLISEAAARTQVIAVSHSSQLLDPLAGSARAAGTELTTIELVKEFGQTAVAGSDAFDGPAWRWPKR